MQHRIAKMLTNLLLIGDKKNSNENILILYGIEVFLNEFTKIIVSLILGIFKEVILFMLLFNIPRSFRYRL